jgi:hypothetical protein
MQTFHLNGRTYEFHSATIAGSISEIVSRASDGDTFSWWDIYDGGDGVLVCLGRWGAPEERIWGPMEVFPVRDFTVGEKGREDLRIRLDSIGKSLQDPMVRILAMSGGLTIEKDWLEP